MKQQLIKLAREAIESEFSGKEIHISIELQNLLTELRGVFITLYKDKHLRGCIGYPQPIHPLGLAIIKAAKAALGQKVAQFAAVEVVEPAPHI